MTGAKMRVLAVLQTPDEARDPSVLHEAWPVSAEMVMCGAMLDSNDIAVRLEQFIDAGVDCQTASAAIAASGLTTGDALSDLRLAIMWRAYVLGVATGVRLGRALED